MDETEYVIDTFKPYVKFEKTIEKNPDWTTYQGRINKKLHIEIVITHHILPTVKLDIINALIDITYDKSLNYTYITILIEQDTKYSTISLNMDTIKEILVETEEEFEKRILE